MDYVDQELVVALTSQARADKRKRAFHIFHDDDEQFNRMLIAGIKGSYAAPHRHTAKFEVFTYVAGDLAVLEFNEDGTIKSAYDLRTCPYVEIAPMTWHAVIFLSDEWAFMEMALWPDKYDPNDKEFAAWAPKEFDDNVPNYIERLSAEIMPVLVR